MRKKIIIILSLMCFFKINIFSGVHNPKSKLEDFNKIEDGKLVENLRNVCNIKSEVNDDTIKKEYDKIIDSVIDNGKNIEITKEVEDKNKDDRFVSFSYNLMILFELSSDKKSLKPVLINTSNGSFNCSTNDSLIEDYEILLINNKNSVEQYFKKDIVDNVNINFYNKNYYKIEDIANVFDKYKPDFFTIIVSSPNYNKQGYNNVKCGFIFKKTKDNKDIFKEDIKLIDDKKNCCGCKKDSKKK